MKRIILGSLLSCMVVGHVFGAAADEPAIPTLQGLCARAITQKAWDAALRGPLSSHEGPVIYPADPQGVRNRVLRDMEDLADARPNVIITADNTTLEQCVDHALEEITTQEDFGPRLFNLKKVAGASACLAVTGWFLAASLHGNGVRDLAHMRRMAKDAGGMFALAVLVGGSGVMVSAGTLNYPFSDFATGYQVTNCAVGVTSVGLFGIGVLGGMLNSVFDFCKYTIKPMISR